MKLELDLMDVVPQPQSALQVGNLFHPVSTTLADRPLNVRAQWGVKTAHVTLAGPDAYDVWTPDEFYLEAEVALVRPARKLRMRLGTDAPHQEAHAWQPGQLVIDSNGVWLALRPMKRELYGRVFLNLRDWQIGAPSGHHRLVFSDWQLLEETPGGDVVLIESTIWTPAA